MDKLPVNITNSQNLTATIQVSVKAADDGEISKDIVSIANPAAITGVTNGTPKTASALGLPEKVEATLDDDSTMMVPVKWDVAGTDYDPSNEDKQTFTVTGTPVHLPDGVSNSQNLTASIRVTVKAAARTDDGKDDDHGDGGNNGGSGGGKSGGGNGNSGSVEQSGATRQASVEAGTDGSLMGMVEITRTIDKNGNTVDEVVLDKKKTREILQKAAENNRDVVRIVIDDLPHDPADEVSVKIPKNALDLIKEQQVALEIKTGDVTITIPKDMIAALPGNELYFRVVPVKKPGEQQTIVERIVQAEEVKQAAGGQDVQVVSKPMVIETNYSNQRTKVLFPLQDVKIPTDPQAQKAFLDSLAVYVEHTDGEKELKTGKIQYDKNGKPEGIKIEITKFSTFTILSLKGKQVAHDPYMTGYPNQTFQPDRPLTREEVATILAHFLQGQKASDQQREGLQAAGQQSMSGAPTDFADVQANHWAAQAISQVRSAGLMTGDAQGLFHPEAKITRAEMATIIAKWKQLTANGQAAAFSDTQGHWAEASIAAVAEQGMMKGYADGSFHPNQGLTRAEAVTLFNRFMGRGPLTGITQAIWSDVPVSHWAFTEIAEATMTHVATKQADGAEVISQKQ
ncbi:S-layer homology domain-containing protein [Brevibacillus fluminis]|uniref:S-layer homology domain-containing protein n=1 Tax=Brevibacillus fluminis TaxID=511487 RepID=UPI003F88F3B1